MDYKYQIKAVTADAVIFSIIDKKLHCLLVKRGVSPFEGKWALPGGFLKRNESAEDAFKRDFLRSRDNLTKRLIVGESLNRTLILKEILETMIITK